MDPYVRQRRDRELVLTCQPYTDAFNAMIKARNAAQWKQNVEVAFTASVNNAHQQQQQQQQRQRSPSPQKRKDRAVAYDSRAINSAGRSERGQNTRTTSPRRRPASSQRGHGDNDWSEDDRSVTTSVRSPRAPKSGRNPGGATSPTSLASQQQQQQLLLQQHQQQQQVVVDVDVAFAQLVMMQMRQERVPMNGETFNLLMECVMNSPGDAVFRIYEDFKREALSPGATIQPTTSTFETLFRACERRGQYERAFGFYMHMKTDIQLRATVNMFNTLLSFCAATQNSTQANYFKEEMLRNGVQPDVHTYNCILAASVGGPYRTALAIFQELKDAVGEVNTRSYNAILEAARCNEDYDRAFLLFEEMKRSGLVPNIVTFNILLSLTEQRLKSVLSSPTAKSMRRTHERRERDKATIAELAVSLFNEICRTPTVLPNTYTFNTVLSVLAQCCDDRAHDVYVKMIDEQQQRKAQSVAPLTVHSDGENGVPLDETGRVLEEMIGKEEVTGPRLIAANSVVPNIETYLTMITGVLERCEAKRGQLSTGQLKALAMQALEYYDAVAATPGLIPEREVYRSMLDVCALTSGEMKAVAQRVYADARRSTVRVDISIFNAFLNCLVQAHDPDALVWLAHQCLRCQDSSSTDNLDWGVIPTVLTINMVIRGCGHWNDPQSAHRLFEMMQQRSMHRGPRTLISIPEECISAGGSQHLYGSLQSIPNVLERASAYKPSDKAVPLSASGSGTSELWAALEAFTMPSPDEDTYFAVMQLLTTCYRRRDAALHKRIAALNSMNLASSSEAVLKTIALISHADHESAMRTAELHKKNSAVAVVEELMAEVRGARLRCTIDHYNALLRALALEGKHGNLIALFETLSGKKLKSELVRRTIAAAEEKSKMGAGQNDTRKAIGRSAESTTFLTEANAAGSAFARSSSPAADPPRMAGFSSSDNITKATPSNTTSPRDVFTQANDALPPANLDTYTTVLEHLSGMDTDEARALLNDVFQLLQTDSSLEPDVHCYHLILRMCERTDDINGALRVAEQLRLSGYAPTKEFYNTLLSTLSKSEHTNILDVLVDMKQSGVLATEETYAAMLKGTESRKQLMQAIARGLFVAD